MASISSAVRTRLPRAAPTAKASRSAVRIAGPVLPRWSWRMAPSSISRRRRARAPSAASWVTTSSVTPPAFSCSSRRITSSPVARSRLPVGSSASSIAGCMMVARAMATRWRWPPDSWSGRWSARSARPKPSSARRTRCVALARRQAGQHHRQRDVLGGRQPRHQVEALEHEADALAAHARLLVGATAWSRRALPAGSGRHRAGRAGPAR